MTEKPRRPGRPKGDAIDDDRLLLEVALLHALDPSWSVRGSVVQLAEARFAADLDRIVRRANDKWSARREVYLDRARLIVVELLNAEPPRREAEACGRAAIPGSALGREMRHALALCRLRRFATMGDVGGVVRLLLEDPRLGRAARIEDHPTIAAASRWLTVPTFLRLLAHRGPRDRQHPAIRRWGMFEAGLARDFPRVARAREGRRKALEASAARRRRALIRSWRGAELRDDD